MLILFIFSALSQFFWTILNVEDNIKKYLLNVYVDLLSSHENIFPFSIYLLIVLYAIHVWKAWKC